MQVCNALSDEPNLVYSSTSIARQKAQPVAELTLAQRMAPRPSALNHVTLRRSLAVSGRSEGEYLTRRYRQNGGKAR